MALPTSSVLAITDEGDTYPMPLTTSTRSNVAVTCAFGMGSPFADTILARTAQVVVILFP